MSYHKHGYTTTAEHMPESHRFVKGWSKEWFLSKAAEIGSSTKEAIDIIMKRTEHVQQGFNAAMGVIRFAKAYSPQRLEKACERALYFKCASYRIIKSILEQKLDQQPLTENTENNINNKNALRHSNIRGAQYYEIEERG